MCKYVYFCTTYRSLLVLGKTSPPLVGSMQEEVYESYERMRQAAAKEGIDIKVVSAHRSYNRQREIWNAKYKTLTCKVCQLKMRFRKLLPIRPYQEPLVTTGVQTSISSTMPIRSLVMCYWQKNFMVMARRVHYVLG